MDDTHADNAPLPIKWRKNAREDFEEIIDDLSKKNPSAAQKLRDNMAKKLSQLSSFPKSCPEGRVAGTREMLLPSYIVVYSEDTEKVRVIGIFHQRQNWSKV